MVRITTLIWLAALTAVPSCSSAVAEPSTAVLHVTADVGVTSLRGRELQGNSRGPTAELRQNQNWKGFESKSLLMAFDTGPIRGWTVSKAYLSVHLARGNLYGAGLCTILGPWQEGTSVGWAQAPGGPCWRFARTPGPDTKPSPKDCWAFKGSGFYSVSWSHPAARYSHAGPGRLTRAKVPGSPNDEVRIPVDAALVESLAAGVAYGLVLTDDKGQVAEAVALKGSGLPYRYNDATDIHVFTKDAKDPKLRPRLVVVGEAIDGARPAALREPEVIAIEPADSTVTLQFIAPGDDGNRGELLAYEAAWFPEPVTDANWSRATPLPRWSLPRPVSAGRKQRMPVFSLAPGRYHLGIRGVDEAGNRGPTTDVAIAIPERPSGKLTELNRRAVKPATRKLPGRRGTLEVFVVGDDAKIDPVTGFVLRDGKRYRRDADLALANAIWRADGATVSLQSAANEVVAFKVILKKLAARLDDLAITISDLATAGGRRIVSAGNVETFRLWYVKTRGGPTPKVGPGDLEDETVRPTAWHGEICVPLSKPFVTRLRMPDPDNRVPSQNFQAVWVDLYVPRGTPGGDYAGTITVSARQLDRPIVLKLKLKVLPFSLPDSNSWVIELNRYHPVGRWNGTTGTQQEVEAERLFYRLAHKHRLILNVLPYTHSGKVDAEYAPPLAGSGATARVADWSAFDKRFGPLLDGSEFREANGYFGPGAYTPISHMYTPFHENWPIPLAGNYRDYRDLKTRRDFAEYASKSGRIAEAISPQFKAGFVNVVVDYFRHFQQKSWTRTALQFYYNNKYYYKVPFFNLRGTGGVSFWLWDEPADFDDYDANAFLLRLALEGYRRADTPRVAIQTRTDVSQAEMTRGLWDNVCNLWNASRMLDYFAPTARVRMKFLPQERYWEYGGGPGETARPVLMFSAALSVWAAGTSGYLPYWNTFSTRNWRRVDYRAIYRSGNTYPGAGSDCIGPAPTVRMKLLRRCQQDIEYLHLLAGRRGWSRPRVRLALADYCDDRNAPIMAFSSLSADQWLRLRAAAAATLLAEVQDRPRPGN